MIQTGSSFFIFVGLVFVILATLTTNITANMVSPINDFMNLAPKKLNWERTTILIGLIGILMQPWRFLADPRPTSGPGCWDTAPSPRHRRGHHRRLLGRPEAEPQAA